MDIDRLAIRSLQCHLKLKLTSSQPVSTATANESDLKTQAQVQQVLEAFKSDPFGLDRDRDRVACESLP